MQDNKANARKHTRAKTKQYLNIGFDILHTLSFICFFDTIRPPKVTKHIVITLSQIIEYTRQDSNHKEAEDYFRKVTAKQNMNIHFHTSFFISFLQKFKVNQHVNINFKQVPIRIICNN